VELKVRLRGVTGGSVDCVVTDWTALPSSDDEAEECSSQGMIDFALDVTA
jgi:hypothetical protein